MLPALLCVVLLLVSAVDGCPDQQETRPLVATREGLVRGVVARSAAGHLFYSFKGIPYAQPPVDSLRFQPPLRHPSWDGVADCDSHGSVCLQYDSFDNLTLKGSEDCLFANVYTPQLSSRDGVLGGLPVMVFIHGGQFTMGNGDAQFYGPSYFMDEQVVLVTFNYRLGPFGFFTTHDSNASGNYGLLDQVLLLQWVQDNIASFGGDPKSVTIFGESAGGSSVSILVLSPLARGLFHHAASHSGTALSSWALSGRRIGSAEKLAKNLNCSSEDTGKMVECIKDQPWEAIMENTDRVRMMFRPRVDREAKYPLIPDDPRSLLERGDFNLVPWINGIVEEEAAVLAASLAANETLLAGLVSGNLSYWGEIADLTTDAESNILDCGVDPSEEIGRIRDRYVSDAEFSRDNLLPLIRLVSDRAFLAPLSAETRLASRHAPVYRYVLDHKGPGRLRLTDLGVPGLGGPDFGPTHGDDLLYLFSNANLPLATPDSPAYTMIRFMVGLLTSFARTGRPSTDVLAMPDWPVFTEHHQRHMRLNSEPSVGERLFEERDDFWQTVRVNEPWRHAVQTSCEEATTARYHPY